MRPRPDFARRWFATVISVWWEKFTTMWDDIGSAMRGEYFPDEESWGDLPEVADAHVDFGGGDE